MPTFKVIVHETTQLTYTIGADSPEQALQIWPAGKRGEPQQNMLHQEVEAGLV
jgi:hypothetical protein